MPYVAQRYGTWEILTRDLPIKITNGKGPEWGLNMYGVLECVIEPEWTTLKAEDGKPTVTAWGTLIHYHTGTGIGARRWSGVVEEAIPYGSQYKIRVRELLGYCDELIFTGNILAVERDPARIFKDLVEYTQARRNGDFGITVSGSTKHRVGTDSDLKAADAKRLMDTAKAALEVRSKPRKAKEEQIRKIKAQYAPVLRPLTRARTAATQAYDLAVKNKRPTAEITAAKAVVTAAQAAVKDKQTQRDDKIQPLQNQLEDYRDAELPWKEPFDEATEVYRKAVDKAREDGGSYKIEAADYPNTWVEMQQLAKDHGFEFSTSTHQTDGIPDYRVKITEGQLGRARPDLIFEQGFNIISEFLPRGVGYASQVLGRGAGEGDKAIRASAARADWRARRNVVLNMPDVTKESRLGTESRAELAWLSGKLEIPSIIVRDRANAKLWSWAVGDSILVKGTIPHVGKYAEWHRITSWQLTSDTTAELRLERV